MHTNHSSISNSKLMSMRDAAKIAGKGLPTLYAELIRLGEFREVTSGEKIPNKHLVDAGHFVVDTHGFTKPGTTISRQYIRVRASMSGAYYLQGVADALG